jgi:hypothetical protein
VIRDAGATSERNHSVNDERFAMRAIVESAE